MRSSEGLPIYLRASWIRDCGKTFKYGDCSSCTASACLRVPSKTESPVVFTNSVRRIESFSVSALVRRVNTSPIAKATTTRPAIPVQSQLFERAVEVPVVDDAAFRLQALATGPAAPEGADIDAGWLALAEMDDEVLNGGWAEPLAGRTRPVPDPVPASEATATAPELRAESSSRLRRFRSLRKSAADW